MTPPDHPLLPGGFERASANFLGRFAMLLALFTATAVQGKWEFKEFEVISAEAVPGGLGLLLEVANPAAELLDEWLVAWGLEPTNFRIYFPEPEVRREIENYLYESAVILEGWGFPPPALPVSEGKYQVVLAAHTQSSISGDKAAGTYTAPICGVINGVLILKASAILGTTSDGDTSPRLTSVGRMVLTHELFHAVQSNSPFAGKSCPPLWGSWIIEGTANAIGVDVLWRLRSEEIEDFDHAFGVRDYSKRLYQDRTQTAIGQAGIQGDHTQF